ncbi:hypothetical protein GW765_01490 [Candidatus Parcubacteria bacterium]|nr:hypothetical protein [Candidatus Parcubacteria bacterium]
MKIFIYGCGLIAPTVMVWDTEIEDYLVLSQEEHDIFYPEEFHFKPLEQVAIIEYDPVTIEPNDYSFLSPKKPFTQDSCNICSESYIHELCRGPPKI